ncbi:hypothetical protein ABZ863_17310, partial [Saccharomonospora sp. NPDC046836]
CSSGRCTEEPASLSCATASSSDNHHRKCARAVRCTDPVSGYGRTENQWVPDQAHTGDFTVESIDTTVSLQGTADSTSICKSDAGAPVLSGGKLVAVASLSHQAGCLLPRLIATVLTSDCGGASGPAPSLSSEHRSVSTAFGKSSNKIPASGGNVEHRATTMSIMRQNHRDLCVDEVPVSHPVSGLAAAMKAYHGSLRQHACPSIKDFAGLEVEPAQVVVEVDV